MTIALSDWEGFDRDHPAPTFFARPAFARALHDAFPKLEIAPLGIRVGGSEFVVPAMRRRTVLGLTSGVALPLGAYSCIRDEHGTVPDEPLLSALIDRASREFDTFEFCGWPLAEQPDPQGWTGVNLTTAVIDCAEGRESAFAGMRGVTRRMAGQASRRGVDCVMSDGSRDDLQRYYAMLTESSHGWGYTEPTIPFALLEAVFSHGGADAELWFAMLEGEPIAGGVVLIGADELFFWSAAMKRDFSRYRPSNALNVRLIERACERGVRWYNLGASEGLAGVERFKHDLGARDVLYRRLQHRNRAASVYLGVRNSFQGALART